jgi:hypothetical protein
LEVSSGVQGGEEKNHYKAAEMEMKHDNEAGAWAEYRHRHRHRHTMDRHANDAMRAMVVHDELGFGGHRQYMYIPISGAKQNCELGWCKRVD